MRAKINLLLVDDDKTLSYVIADYLRSRNYIVDLAGDGNEALKMLQSTHYDICVMDILMPVMTGLEALSQIRNSHMDLPVIMFTERTSQEDMLAAYKAGCDDYVTKPCSMELLICHIEAIMRRIMGVEDEQTQIFDLGGVKFDSVRQLLNDVHLSSRESELLAMLCRSKETVVSRSMILKTIWGYDTYFAARSLSVYVNHLRHFLEEAGCEYKIMAVHGKGYKIISPLS
ncbi:MAG: response regulator transcription factor [Paludibacteraceae bacterium]|nr:response regulator transcription factor [Paludibacteraceae bacterium]